MDFSTGLYQALQGRPQTFSQEEYQQDSYAQAVKIASCFDNDDLAWLDRFRGTPLFDEATQLAVHQLEIESQLSEAREQQRQASESVDPVLRNLHAQQDKLSLLKKGLEIRLLSAGATTPVVPPDGAPPLAAPVAPEVATPEPTAPVVKSASLHSLLFGR